MLRGARCAIFLDFDVGKKRERNSNLECTNINISSSCEGYPMLLNNFVDSLDTGKVHFSMAQNPGCLFDFLRPNDRLS